MEETNKKHYLLYDSNSTERSCRDFVVIGTSACCPHKSSLPEPGQEDDAEILGKMATTGEFLLEAAFIQAFFPFFSMCGIF